MPVTLQEPHSTPQRSSSSSVYAGVVSFVAGGVLLLVLFGYLAGRDTCVNDHDLQVLSPSGERKAVIFRRNCGATTAFSTQVSILPAKSGLPSGPGNVFAIKYEPPIGARWTDDFHLVISGTGSGAPVLRRTESGKVHISYEP